MSKFDLLIFDFDGTLVNSIPPAVEAIAEMLKKLGYPEKSHEEINKHVGYGERALVAGSICSEDEQEINKAKEVYFKLYCERLKHIPLYPHVEETLKTLKNKTMSIISNKNDDFIAIILKNRKLDKLFSDIIGGENSYPLKPDPFTVNMLRQKHKMSRQQTLFIGDMTIDVETGKNAGVATCAAAYGFDAK
ncbi:MAG: HAD-IA family hydrolase, partial [Candidatus Margulisbacteria bacterium]|nr:HAD-IA family hydrolase [Candidatus Margulisiibacteriota bacterium]